MRTPANRTVPEVRRRSLIYEWSIVAAAVILIVFVLVAGKWTWKLDQVLYDAGLSLLERPPRGDIVIVAIDADSIDSVGKWPWRRATVATLLDRIAAAKPKAVGLDIVFTAPDYAHPKDDTMLAEALSRTPNALLPMISVQGRPLLPIDKLAERARLVSVDAAPDPDALLRSVPLEVGQSGQSYPHMALALAQIGGAPEASLPTGDFMIPFAGPPGAFRHISAAKILRGDIAPAELAGKLVLIGITAPGFADRYATPSTTEHRPMAGVEAMANVLDALLEGRHIRQLGTYTVGFISAAMMLMLLLLFYQARPALSLYLMLATVVTTPLVSLLLLAHFGVWFPPMSVAISTLIAYPLWSWKRLEAICYFLDQEILRLRDDYPSGPRASPSGTVGFADHIQQRIELIRVNIDYLRAARKFLGESLDGLPHAALVVTPDGQLVVANHRALELCRLTKNALPGRDIEDALKHILLTDSDWRQAMSAALAGKSLDLKASDLPGREYEVALAAFRDDAGRVSGLIVVIDDVTTLRQAQREREEALSFLSHDIRSPQSSIMALAELQRHDETRQPETDFVASVEELAAKTAALAEDFLQLARADSKPLDLAEHDFAALLENCVAEIAPQARTKGIAIEITEATEPIAVMIDRSLLARAIGNLLVNAIKHSPSGGHIVAQCRVADGLAVCSIGDNGPGIDAADQPRLFKRFSRLHGGGSMAAGSGLGLAFVDVVARRHGGTVDIDSTAGKGAIFSISLPLLAVPPEG